MPSILLTNYYGDAPLRVVRNQLPDGFELLSLNEPGRNEILRQAPKADYLLVGGRVKIDREVIDAAPKLKMVQRTGVGLDSLDLEYLRQKNIPVYVNAGVNSRSVAEHTVMLILSTLRRLPQIDTATKSGKWLKHDLGIQCNDLYGKTVGMIGLGAIGYTVAQMLQPFGVHIVYHKRNRLPIEEEQAINASYQSLDAVLESADILSIHCPVTPETNRLIGRKQLNSMKTGSIIVNTARGKIIDQDALCEALTNGPIRGAGLDTFESEPIPENNPILSQQNAIITPHLSGLTIETFSEMMKNGFSNIEAFHSGDKTSIEKKLLKL